MNKERLSEWKSFNDYEKIVSIIKNGRLDDFVAGRVLKRGGHTQTPADDITDAGIVLMFLDAIMTEGYITNQEINDALSKLEILEFNHSSGKSLMINFSFNSIKDVYFLQGIKQASKVSPFLTILVTMCLFFFSHFSSPGQFEQYIKSFVKS